MVTETFADIHRDVSIALLRQQLEVAYRLAAHYHRLEDHDPHARDITHHMVSFLHHYAPKDQAASHTDQFLDVDFKHIKKFVSAAIKQHEEKLEGHTKNLSKQVKEDVSEHKKDFYGRRKSQPGLDKTEYRDIKRTMRAEGKEDKLELRHAALLAAQSRWQDAVAPLTKKVYENRGDVSTPLTGVDVAAVREVEELSWVAMELKFIRRTLAEGDFGANALEMSATKGRTKRLLAKLSPKKRLTEAVTKSGTKGHLEAEIEDDAAIRFLSAQLERPIRTFETKVEKIPTPVEIEMPTREVPTSTGNPLWQLWGVVTEQVSASVSSAASFVQETGESLLEYVDPSIKERVTAANEYVQDTTNSIFNYGKSFLSLANDFVSAPKPDPQKHLLTQTAARAQVHLNVAVAGAMSNIMFGLDYLIHQHGCRDAQKLQENLYKELKKTSFNTTLKEKIALGMPILHEDLYNPHARQAEHIKQQLSVDPKGSTLTYEEAKSAETKHILDALDKVMGEPSNNCSDALLDLMTLAHWTAWYGNYVHNMNATFATTGYMFNNAPGSVAAQPGFLKSRATQLTAGVLADYLPMFDMGPAVRALTGFTDQLNKGYYAPPPQEKVEAGRQAMGVEAKPAHWYTDFWHKIRDFVSEHFPSTLKHAFKMLDVRPALGSLKNTVEEKLSAQSKKRAALEAAPEEERHVGRISTRNASRF